jgi:hypothetical protein
MKLAAFRGRSHHTTVIGSLHIIYIYHLNGAQNQREAA